MRSRTFATPGFAGAFSAAEKAAVGGAILLSLSLGSPQAVRPQDRAIARESCTRLRTDPARPGDEIVLLPIDAPVTIPVIEDAIDRWRRCDGYSTAFPRFLIGEGSGPNVKVRIETRAPGAGFCGRFEGQMITVYLRARLGDAIVRCPSSARVLAHELGHVLGLRDVESLKGCPTFIMSGIVDSAPSLQRVAESECSAVGRKWVTSAEERNVEVSPASQRSVKTGGTITSTFLDEPRGAPALASPRP